MLQVVARRSDGGQLGVEHRPGPLETLGVEVPRRQWATLLAEHLAGHLGDRDGDVAVPEVHRGDQSGAPGEPDRGAPPTRARDRAHHLGGGQLAHDRGHRAGSEPGLAGDVGLGRWRPAPVQQQGEHPLLVGHPQRGGRTWRGPARRAGLGGHG